MPSGSRSAWCVLATHPKAERRAHACLHLRGWHAYLPLITVRLPNRHYHTHALFPGYIFVRLDLSRPWHPVTACPGVFQLLAIDGIPTPCPPGVVEAIQAGDELRSIPTPRQSLWRPGAACEALLAGGNSVEGVVLSVRGERAVIATIMFGALREMSVPVDCLTVRN